MSLHSAVVIMEVHFLKYHKRLKRGEKWFSVQCKCKTAMITLFALPTWNVRNFSSL